MKLKKKKLNNHMNVVFLLGSTKCTQFLVHLWLLFKEKFKIDRLLDMVWKLTKWAFRG